MWINSLTLSTKFGFTMTRKLKRFTFSNKIYYNHSTIQAGVLLNKTRVYIWLTLNISNTPGDQKTAWNIKSLRYQAFVCLSCLPRAQHICSKYQRVWDIEYSRNRESTVLPSNILTLHWKLQFYTLTKKFSSSYHQKYLGLFSIYQYLDSPWKLLS